MFAKSLKLRLLDDDEIDVDLETCHFGLHTSSRKCAPTPLMQTGNNLNMYFLSIVWNLFLSIVWNLYYCTRQTFVQHQTRFNPVQVPQVACLTLKVGNIQLNMSMNAYASRLDPSKVKLHHGFRPIAHAGKLCKKSKRMCVLFAGPANIVGIFQKPVYSTFCRLANPLTHISCKWTKIFVRCLFSAEIEGTCLTKLCAARVSRTSDILRRSFRSGALDCTPATVCGPDVLQSQLFRAMGLSLHSFVTFFVLWEGIYWLARRLLRAPAAVRMLTPVVRRDGPAYVVSTVHALFAASRGVRHVASLWRAPAVLKNVIPVGSWLTTDMLPYLPAARAVITTNISLAAYLTSDLAHVIVQYPKLGGADTIAHHFSFLACALFAGSGDMFP
jgi:hypothetical protein